VELGFLPFSPKGLGKERLIIKEWPPLPLGITFLKGLKRASSMGRTFKGRNWALPQKMF